MLGEKYMGASYVSHTFQKCSSKELNSKVMDCCTEAAYEQGHSYSGDWGEKLDSGVNIIDKTYSSVKEADDWLSDNTPKYGALKAVKAPAEATNVNTDKLREKLKPLQNELDELRVQTGEKRPFFRCKSKAFHTLILERVKAGKSQFRACNNCGSKVSIKFLNHHACPVCSSNEFLLTDTDKKRLLALSAKTEKHKAKVAAVHEAIDEKHRIAQSKIKPSSNWVWVVGGWCSS